MKLMTPLLASAVTAMLAASPVSASGNNATPSQPTQGVKRFLDTLNSGTGKPIEQLWPADARAVLTGAQAGAELPPAVVTKRTIHADGQSIELEIVRPVGSEKQVLPAFMFFHGGGWVLGDFSTHERLIRDLVNASGAVAVYVNYTPSPEAHFPMAIHQAYAATKWVAEHGGEIGVDGTRLALAGNSVGGNMVASVALQAKAAHVPEIRYAVMLWPVTDAAFDTASYQTYQKGYFLSRNMMKWFWDSYAPTVADRASILASPLRATTSELKSFPPTLIQTAELDVLRDEGEAFGRKLDASGVDVTVTRYNGMIHDYGLLNALSNEPTVRTAIRQAGMELHDHLAQ